MIILRYFTREILTATLVITVALLLFSIGQRFAQYLDDAWRGDLEPNVLLIILAYRIPEFLTLILPISFFMGTLYALGRFYVENEMVVLSSCGMPQSRLLAYCLVSGTTIAMIVGALTLYAAPYGLQKMEGIREAQKLRSELDLLAANRFQEISDGNAVAYFQSFNDSREKIEQVFIAEMAPEGQSEATDELFVLTAAEGETWIDPDTSRRYLLLHNGYQYVGRPGEPGYRELKFDTYGYYLQQREPEKYPSDNLEILNFNQLRARSDAKASAELQWRLALPLLVFVITFIAVPMSYTSPRKGRFVKLLPAFMLLVIYLGLLVFSKGKIAEEKFSPSLGLWWVHGAFIGLAALLLWWNNGQPKGRWLSKKQRLAADA